MPTYYPDFNLGQRIDGTFKGPGFATATSDMGDLITEMSAGPPDANYPMVYKGITPWEMLFLQDAPFTPYQQWSPELHQINDWALYQASLRNMSGQPLFWQPSDGMPGLNYTPHW